MDDRPRGTGDGDRELSYLAPVGRVSRGRPLFPVVTLALVTVLVAIVKPWGVGGAPGASSAASGVLSDSPGPPAAASSPVRIGGTGLDAELTNICHNTDAWLLATVERDRGQTVRILRVLGAGSPSGSSLPRVTFGSESVMELGWCAPITGPDPSTGVTTVDAWRLSDGRIRTLDLPAPVPLGVTSSFGALYVPPPGASIPTAPSPAPGSSRAPSSGVVGDPASTSWRSGIYTFLLHTADGGTESFAVDIEILPARGPDRATPSRAPSSGGSGAP